MPETKEQIRHQFYEWFKAETTKPIDKDTHYKIKDFFIRHDNAERKNVEQRLLQNTNVQLKVSKYLEKAKTLPASPNLKIQVETLRLVSRWLQEKPETSTSV